VLGDTTLATMDASGLVQAKLGLTVTGGDSSVVALTASGVVTAEDGLAVTGSNMSVTNHLDVSGDTTLATMNASGLVLANGGLTVTGGPTAVVALTASDTIVCESTVSATSFLSTSDMRLKKNIVEIQDPLEKICKLGGYTFDWASRYEGHSVGVMAQEVMEVLPDAVVVNDDGYMQVDYTRLVPLLIGSIKELKYQIEMQGTPPV
jgi:hypothetical protein